MVPIASFLQDPDLIRSLYIVAFICFILGLHFLNHPRTARRGNLVAAVGMAIAVVATLLMEEIGDYGLIALGIVGGAAVALISWSEYRESLAAGGNPDLETLIPLLFAAIIGSISFWGSNIAFGKLQELIPGRPIQLPGQQFVNAALIVAGMLVGASGSILTHLMAEAMNRSIPNIVAGGFGGVAVAAGAGGDEDRGPVRSTDPADVAIQLAYAGKVVVAPGYGMAVAQAQHTVRELADELEKRGVRVDYAIHPVAGRMPGHMNVLLAEADVPYDHLKEMDEINPELPYTDVALVIGANDVTNPAAREEEGSPIYGMPILDVDKAGQVIVLKRSMNPGFAGIDNPLFYNENTALLFGDAKESVASVLAEVKEL